MIKLIEPLKVLTNLVNYAREAEGEELKAVNLLLTKVTVKVV